MEEAARRALKDLLIHRSVFEQTLASAGKPYGLGVAWGTGLTPSTGQVLLATPDTIHYAVQLLVV